MEETKIIEGTKRKYSEIDDSAVTLRKKDIARGGEAMGKLVLYFQREIPKLYQEFHQEDSRRASARRGCGPSGQVESNGWSQMEIEIDFTNSKYML